MPLDLPYREVWLIDYEFAAPPGHRPLPVCLVGRELRSARVVRVFQDEIATMPGPPYACDRESLVVAYYASAEIGCHLALGWPAPANVLDLFAEFRARTNGLSLPCGSGLLGALVYFGEVAMAADEKADMRDLIMRGGPWSQAERHAILEYCEQDVDALARLLPHLLRKLGDTELQRALLRGRYMVAAARMELIGVPLDVQVLDALRRHWGQIKLAMVEDLGAAFGVYDGTRFKAARWERWLAQRGIRWPRSPSGMLKLDDNTFKDMSKVHAGIATMRQLRHAMGQLRLTELAVGPDGRNRTLLSAFRSRSGRNQPSNSRFIFGAPAWLRSLIMPAPGIALAYVDYARQEFGIAAALSGDEGMIQAYRSGDPYLAFAEQAGAMPTGISEVQRERIREQFKQCALGVQYGMAEDRLAERTGQTRAAARELLSHHRTLFADYWRWSGRVVDHAMMHSSLDAAFGWRYHIGGSANPRSVANFPMQANGAEMMRLASISAIEAGIELCCPVHDAFLIQAPAGQIDAAVDGMQTAMREASAAVLGGFQLATDVKVVLPGTRYRDPRGAAMWSAVCSALARLDRAIELPEPVHQCNEPVR